MCSWHSRDGFIDRYSGERLVFPGTLRLLSQLMPEHFPAHKNWKRAESHIAFWELFPTIDHVVPVARGGADEEANWVSTSMLRNSAKAQWTLDELGWELHEPGSLDEWDGLTGWLLEYTAAHPEVVSSGYLKRWRKAATPTKIVSPQRSSPSTVFPSVPQASTPSSVRRG